MEDFVMLHKSIIDDWKFQDEGVLKFWILLLIEEKLAPKEKEGLFSIRSLNKITKRADITHQKAHRLLKKMEVRGDIEFLSSYFKGKGQPFGNVNNRTTTRVSIKRKQPSGEFTGAKSGIFPTDLKPNDGELGSCFKEKKAALSSAYSTARETAYSKIFPWEPGDPEYLERIEEFEKENGIENGVFTGVKSGTFLADPRPCNGEVESCFTQEDAEVSPAYLPVGEAANLNGDIKPEKTTTHTKEDEDRAYRRIALKMVIREEIGYLVNDETINRFMNELFAEYDGSPEKEIQLAVRQNFLRKLHGSLGDTLEIRKAELYAQHKDYPIILSPRVRVLCSNYLDREFLKISRKEAIQYDEQKMIKVNVRGPRKIGDIAKELVKKLTGDKPGALLTDTKTSNEEVKPNVEPENPAHIPAINPANFPEDSTPTESNPSNHVGAELALKSINEVNTILNTNIKNISTSTVQENKLSTVQENIFFKGGYRGEKNQEGFVAENPTENSPTKKNETKTLKVAEYHPDGRPVFSSKAFKSLPRTKQIQIIGERLNDFAELFPTVDVEFQFDHWKDWMDAKGQTFKDYSAAFRNWLRKGLDLAAKNNSGSPAKIYTETGAKFVTQEVFTNPAHVPFKKEAPRNPNLKRRPGIGGVE